MYRVLLYFNYEYYYCIGKVINVIGSCDCYKLIDYNCVEICLLKRFLGIERF